MKIVSKNALVYSSFQFPIQFKPSSKLIDITVCIDTRLIKVNTCGKYSEKPEHIRRISYYLPHGRHTYWKMTNLNRNWGGSAGKHENLLSTKNHSDNHQRKSLQEEHHPSRKSFFTGTHNHLYLTKLFGFFPNTVEKELLCRSGPISWRLLPSGRAVSVYGDGKGFIVKVGANSPYDYPSLLILKLLILYR